MHFVGLFFVFISNAYITESVLVRLPLKVYVCVCGSGKPADFGRLVPQEIASKSHPSNCAAQRRGMKRYAPMSPLSLFFMGVRSSVAGPRGSYVNDVSPALWYANEVTNSLVTIFMAHLFAAYMVNFP